MSSSKAQAKQIRQMFHHQRAQVEKMLQIILNMKGAGQGNMAITPPSLTEAVFFSDFKTEI